MLFLRHHLCCLFRQDLSLAVTLWVGWAGWTEPKALLVSTFPVLGLQTCATISDSFHMGFGDGLIRLVEQSTELPHWLHGKF